MIYSSTIPPSFLVLLLFFFLSCFPPLSLFFFLMIRHPPRSTLFPYPPLSRSISALEVEALARREHARHRRPPGASLLIADAEDQVLIGPHAEHGGHPVGSVGGQVLLYVLDRKSTRLNSSHQIISYAVFCLKKK